MGQDDYSQSWIRESPEHICDFVINIEKREK